MQREIKIRDLTSPRFKAITFIAAGLLVLAGVCWFMQVPSYYAYIAAAVAVALFAFLSMESFTVSNSVSYGGKSVTMKLLGHKTIGFLFSSVREVNLLEQGLLIRIDGQEDLKLSRKRYTTTSLEELTRLLKEKTALQ